MFQTVARYISAITIFAKTVVIKLKGTVAGVIPRLVEACVHVRKVLILSRAAARSGASVVSESTATGSLKGNIYDTDYHSEDVFNSVEFSLLGLVIVVIAIEVKGCLFVGSLLVELA
jgi:hypothetical protein